MKIHSLCCFVGALLLLSVHGWWETGHMLVAEIAKQELLKSRPEVYRRAEEISLFVKGLTNNLSDSFVESAVWLDDVKVDEFESFFTWHFTGRPYNPLGLQFNSVVQYDAIYAINQAIKVLSNHKTTGKITLTKSIFMRILCHVVGDIHQPLHSTDLYNLTFPQGDQGGNLENVTVEALNQTMPLHSYWDAIAFQFPGNLKRPLNKESSSIIENLAQNLTKEFPKEAFASQLGDIDINKWTIDSYLDAIAYVYKPLRDDFIIDQAYQDQALHIMKRKLALGGYRLANILETILHQDVQAQRFYKLRGSKTIKF